MGLLDALVARHVGELHEGADAQGAVRLDLDVVEPGNALEVDDAGRLLEMLLEMVDDVDAARLVDAPGFFLDEILGLGEGCAAWMTSKRFMGVKPSAGLQRVRPACDLG